MRKKNSLFLALLNVLERLQNYQKRLLNHFTRLQNRLDRLQNRLERLYKMTLGTTSLKYIELKIYNYRRDVVLVKNNYESGGEGQLFFMTILTY